MLDLNYRSSFILRVRSRKWILQGTTLSNCFVAESKIGLKISRSNLLKFDVHIIQIVGEDRGEDLLLKDP